MQRRLYCSQIKCWISALKPQSLRDMLQLQFELITVSFISTGCISTTKRRRINQRSRRGIHDLLLWDMKRGLQFERGLHLIQPWLVWDRYLPPLLAFPQVLRHTNAHGHAPEAAVVLTTRTVFSRTRPSSHYISPFCSSSSPRLIDSVSPVLPCTLINTSYSQD